MELRQLNDQDELERETVPRVTQEGLRVVVKPDQGAYSRMKQTHTHRNSLSVNLQLETSTTSRS